MSNLMVCFDTETVMKPRFYSLAPMDHTNQDSPKIDGLVSDRSITTVTTYTGHRRHNRTLSNHYMYQKLFSQFKSVRVCCVRACMCVTTSVVGYSLSVWPSCWSSIIHCFKFTVKLILYIRSFIWSVLSIIYIYIYIYSDLFITSILNAFNNVIINAFFILMHLWMVQVAGYSTEKWCLITMLLSWCM